MFQHFKFEFKKHLDIEKKLLSELLQIEVVSFLKSPIKVDLAVLE